MKIIMHKQLTIDNRLDLMVKANPQLKILTRAELINLCLEEIKKEANAKVTKINVLDKISVQQDNTSAIAFDIIQKGEKVLVMPVILAINDYATFIKALNSIDPTICNKIAYYDGKIPYITDDFIPWKSTAMPSNIWSLSSSSMSLAIDFDTHPVNKLLETIAQTVGYNGISSIFPALSGIEFKSSRTIIERQEYYLSNYKILLY